ncbi:MAG TPA: hypothetical protein VL882_00630 [Vicinamibacterales bacterium]|jgi:hypothetical protein|nr:hypothetical protein [Vicinamibacterales bacterium]
MIDREKVLAVLNKRFPEAGRENVAAAANAIVGLEDEWEEVEVRLAQQAESGDGFKLYRRRTARG